MRASLACAFTGISGMGCAAVAALPGPVLDHTGPLTRDEVFTIREAGDAPSCANAGGAFVEARGGPVDWERGASYSKMGCDGGHPNGCAGLDQLAAAYR